MLPTEEWPLERFKPDEQELARHDDVEESQRLGDDMLANGQLQDVSATKDGRMIFGHGRFVAARLVGIKTLTVKVYPSLDDTQFILTRAAENLQRKELTSYRRWLLCEGLIKQNGWDQKTLAEKIHLDPSQVTRLLSPSKCSPDWREALKAGKVTISDCYAASKLAESDQGGLLALRLSGQVIGREGMERQARKQREASTPAVRTSKIKMPLVGGPIVTVTGDDLSLDDAIEAMKEAAKAMAKARDQGLDAKTAQAVWRDLANAG